MMLEKGGKKKVILITGLSGSGLRTAINSLDDIGFFCVDNLPLSLLTQTMAALDGAEASKYRGMAFGIRVTTPAEVELFLNLKRHLSLSCNIDHLFLESDPGVLVARYSETRRRHLLYQKNATLIQLMDVEKAMTAPLRERADSVIDTSNFSPTMLSRLLIDRYEKDGFSRRLYVSIMSFGFKHGQPPELESMFDVRFLQNPYFISSLREKSGLDEPVVEFLRQQQDFQTLLEKMTSWYLWALPKYYDEGKHYFRIGVGCTGGKHRSVCVAKTLLDGLESKGPENFSYVLSHRDLN